MNTAIATQNNAITPMSMMQIAIEKGTDLDQLSKLMDMSERYEATEAKKAYTRAMAQFKLDSVTITKDKTVSYAGTNYTHSSLANVVKTITGELSRHGLSHTWRTHQLDSGIIQVTCIITHELGHSEETTLQSAPDDSGKKNNIQAIGSAVSYLQRYTLLAATGTATGDQDDDGIVAEDRLSITSEQVVFIDKLIESSGKKDGFFKYYNIESTGNLQQRDYPEAVAMLEKAVRRASK